MRTVNMWVRCGRRCPAVASSSGATDEAAERLRGTRYESAAERAVATRVHAESVMDARHASSSRRRSVATEQPPRSRIN